MLPARARAIVPRWTPICRSGSPAAPPAAYAASFLPVIPEHSTPAQKLLAKRGLISICLPAFYGTCFLAILFLLFFFLIIFFDGS